MGERSDSQNKIKVKILFSSRAWEWEVAEDYGYCIYFGEKETNKKKKKTDLKRSGRTSLHEKEGKKTMFCRSRDRHQKHYYCLCKTGEDKIFKSAFSNLSWVSVFLSTLLDSCCPQLLNRCWKLITWSSCVFMEIKTDSPEFPVGLSHCRYLFLKERNLLGRVLKGWIVEFWQVYCNRVLQQLSLLPPEVSGCTYLVIPSCVERRNH